MPAGLRVPSPSSSAGPVVHLSVAIGRFFEALLYAMLSVAFRVLLEIGLGVAVLVALFVLARRLIGRNKPRS